MQAHSVYWSICPSQISKRNPHALGNFSVFSGVKERDCVYLVFGKCYIKNISSFKIHFFFLQQINPELLYQTSVSSQSFSPVKESVPRPHLSEVTSPFAARIINLNLASPASEPENSRLVVKITFICRIRMDMYMILLQQF